MRLNTLKNLSAKTHRLSLPITHDGGIDMTRAIKLFGFQTRRKAELSNIIAARSQDVSDIEAEMSNISDVTELKGLHADCQKHEAVIKVAEQQLADIAAQSQGINNVKTVNISDFILGVR